MKKLALAIILTLLPMGAAAQNAPYSTTTGATNNCNESGTSLAAGSTTAACLVSLPTKSYNWISCYTYAHANVEANHGGAASVNLTGLGVSNPEGNGTCTAAGQPFSCCTGAGTSNGTGVCAWGYPMAPFIGLDHLTSILPTVNLLTGQTGSVSDYRIDATVSDGTLVPGNPPIILPNGNNGSSAPKISVSLTNSASSAAAVDWELHVGMVCIPIIYCGQTSGCGNGAME